MGDIDLTALNVPLFSAIFGMGWGACYTILVLPMKERVNKLEARIVAVEEAKDERIAALERKLGIT
jgi:hypothetical protein